MPEIKITNLTVSYPLNKDAYVALEDVSLVFGSQKINMIIGPSGGGKTTLLKTLCGLLPYDGEIYFDNKNYADMSLKEANISYVSQKFDLYSKFTIFENIAFPLTLKKLDTLDIRKKVNNLAILLGIDNCLSRLPNELSIGQKQRVSLARALIKEPTVLFLDEPFSNLDPKISYDIVALLKNIIKEKGLTIVFVTHEIKDIFSFADTLTIIDEKKVVFNGDKQDALNNPNLRQYFGL